MTWLAIALGGTLGSHYRYGIGLAAVFEKPSTQDPRRHVAHDPLLRRLNHLFSLQTLELI